MVPRMPGGPAGSAGEAAARGPGQADQAAVHPPADAGEELDPLGRVGQLDVRLDRRVVQPEPGKVVQLQAGDVRLDDVGCLLRRLQLG
jgi:hypothetical protein